MSRWAPVFVSKTRTAAMFTGISTVLGMTAAIIYLSLFVRFDLLANLMWRQFQSWLAFSKTAQAKADLAFMEAAKAFPDYSSKLYIAFAILMLTLIGCMALFYDVMKRKEVDLVVGEHVSGNKEVSYEEAIKEIEAKLKDPLTAYDYRHTPQDIRVQAYKEKKTFRFPRYAGAGHRLYLGASGSGKSKLMFADLEQIRAAGSKAIILDPGGRYQARLRRTGDRIFSIYDKRSEYYDFWSEPGFDYFALASSLIESRASAGGKDDFFTESPQSLFAGLLKISEVGGMNELKKHIYDPDIEALQERLRDSTEVSAQFLKDSRLAANVMASYATKLYWLKYLNHWAIQDGRITKRGISEWARDDSDRSWVFLVADEKDWEASKHYFRMLTTITGKAVYGRGEYPGRVDIVEVQDEIESIGYNSELSQKLNIGRKDGYMVFGGLQAASQFYSLYGKDVAHTILQGFQNKFLFKTEDPDLAKLMASFTGMGRWRVRDEQVSNDGKASVSMKMEERPAFRSEEFFSLRSGECVAKVSGINPFKFAVPYRKFEPIEAESMSEIPTI